MTGLRRTRSQVRRLIDRNIAPLRAAPALLLSAVALLLVTLILIVTAAKTGWTDLLQGFASNVVAAAVLGGFAYLIFVLRFRRAKLSGYLDRYRPRGTTGDDTRPSGPYAALLRTVVDELLAARPPSSCLLVGDADVARNDALAELPVMLAARKLVPVVVDLRRERTVASIAVCARTRFVADLVGSAGDEASGGRVFANLLMNERAVAVVVGLERLNEGRSMRERCEAIADLLRGCLSERLPFVAALPDDLAPSISEIAVLRIPRVSRGELGARFGRRVRDRARLSDPEVDEHFQELFDELAEPTRDPFYLDLAIDCLISRVRQGESVVGAAEALFADPRAFRRQLGWMCERALECGLPDAAAASSAVAFALRTIGAEMHYRQDLPTTWGDVCRDLDQDGERRFALGVSALTRMGVVTIAGEGDRVLRFAHPGWLALAGGLGVGLESSRWTDLLRPGVAQATLDALTVAMLLDPGAARGDDRSFLQVLARLAGKDESNISLDLAVAAIAALQLDEKPLELGRRELCSLERSWRLSTDATRLSFIDKIDFNRCQELTDLLWQEVVPPAFQKNSYRVRRRACMKLASLGELAWGRLEWTWKELVDEAKYRDLSPAMRSMADWQDYGLPLASLCWVLPSLAIELDGDERRKATDLLHDVRGIARKGWGAKPAGTGRADIGLEISLAEGFKIAAARMAPSDDRYETAPRGMAPSAASADDRWLAETRDFFSSAKSWVSAQALVHSLALADPDDERMGGFARQTAGSADQHPFVREAAALVLRGIESQPAGIARQRYAWLNDVQALDDGGLDLVPEGHRLLGLSTLLINFAEHSFRIREDGADSRDRAFTTSDLPRCFRRSGDTATMFESPCECEFGLCGPDAKGEIGDRRFSRAFAKRAEATCAAPVLSEHGAFVGEPFRDVWRVLDVELAESSTSS